VRFFITTAIDYVNGRPHLGHAYEKVLADALARYQRSLGREVYFLTGVDEHGQKVAQSARRLGRAAAEFCDEMTGYFLEAWRTLGISYDAFVRTTSAKHKLYVRWALQKLHEKGDITFKEHEGYYSVRQEQFVTEKDMVDGKWPEIFGEVIRTSEPNYFFNLERYRGKWMEILKADEGWIVPAFRRNELLNALEHPLDDLCISRPRSRLEWGIPLPFDENYVTYVWFDALLNYASFADEAGGINRWPADLQVIGKDILIPAHGVYWPLMLLALDLPLPRRLIVHGWWQVRGQKMSKSTGTAVNPMELAQKYGADAFRYYLLREMSTGHDADFSVEGFHQRYTSDLGNDLGNLLQRTVSMTHRYLNGSVPTGGVDSTLEEQAEAAFRELCSAMEVYETHRALEGVWKFVRFCNRYLEDKAPWKMAKDAALSSLLEEVLRSVLKACVRISVLIEPFMPVTALEMRRQLGVLTVVSLLNWEELPAPVKVSDAVPLFPRLDFDFSE
jgi:methionyl-tRNA synthetase